MTIKNVRLAQVKRRPLDPRYIEFTNGDWGLEKAPLVDAWRVRTDTAAFRCPACGGLHFKGVPAAGSFMVTRTLTCPSEFRTDDLESVNLRLHPEPAPREWVRAYDRPWGSISAAYRLLRRRFRGPAQNLNAGSVIEAVDLAITTLRQNGRSKVAAACKAEADRLARAERKKLGTDRAACIADCAEFCQRLMVALLECHRGVGR
jgi:hypothetical protein